MGICSDGEVMDRGRSPARDAGQETRGKGRLTFDKRGFEVGGPYDLALALHGLPAFSAGDDSLDGVVDAAGGGDGVGEVVGGGDVDVLCEVVAVVGGHGEQGAPGLWTAAEGGREWEREGGGQRSD